MKYALVNADHDADVVDLYIRTPICLHGIVLNYVVKHRDNFTYAFYEANAPMLNSFDTENVTE
jgi:hypothetical protein